MTKVILPVWYISFLFFLCGKKKKEKGEPGSLSPEQREISGDLGTPSQAVNESGVHHGPRFSTAATTTLDVRRLYRMLARQSGGRS